MQLVIDAVAGAAALVALIIAYPRCMATGSIAGRHRAEAQLAILDGVHAESSR